MGAERAQIGYRDKWDFSGLKYSLTRKKNHLHSYKNPTICQAKNLRAASQALRNCQIICGNYKTVLSENAKPGDFVYLAPPYLPVSRSADFKRYTKEQFYEEDHRELAEEVKRLHRLGCRFVLTNPNHPLLSGPLSAFITMACGSNRSFSIGHRSSIISTVAFVSMEIRIRDIKTKKSAILLVFWPVGRLSPSDA